MPGLCQGDEHRLPTWINLGAGFLCDSEVQIYLITVKWVQIGSVIGSDANRAHPSDTVLVILMGVVYQIHS